jgi:hypothetical protein
LKNQSNFSSHQPTHIAPLPRGPGQPTTRPTPAMPDPHPTLPQPVAPYLPHTASKLELPIPKSQTLGDCGRRRRSAWRRAAVGTGARRSAAALSSARAARLGGAPRGKRRVLGPARGSRHGRTAFCGGAQLGSAAALSSARAARLGGAGGQAARPRRKRRVLGAARRASRRPAPARRASAPDCQGSGRAAQAASKPRGGAAAGRPTRRGRGDRGRRAASAKRPNNESTGCVGRPLPGTCRSGSVRLLPSLPLQGA